MSSANKKFVPLNIAVLTVSDTRNKSTDSSGDYLAQSAKEEGHAIVKRDIVIDDVYLIRELVSHYIANKNVNVILITGGTGFTQRDSTPEAVTPLFDKTVEGFGELFRYISFKEIGTSTIQSRAIAGLANGTVIFCLPGSTGACKTAWQGILKDQLDGAHGPCNFVPHLYQQEDVQPLHNKKRMSNKAPTNATLTHVDKNGAAHMVDVSDKIPTARIAVAEGFVSMSPELITKIQQNLLAKGDVFSVARIAGIQGSKNCANLIPLCHPLMLTKVQLDFEIDEANSQVRVQCLCKLVGNTGVEMEALTGVSIAALTIFDMCKAVDPSMTIHSIRVLEKQGGKSGIWRR